MFPDITFVDLVVGYFIYKLINSIGAVIVRKGIPVTQVYKDDMDMYANHFISKTFKDPHLHPEVKGLVAVKVYGTHIFGTPPNKS